ncbi:hypothetical protein P5673_012981 [Acropora cervicornis]|uniref:Uncharacterized protein n=1 Tax=Acropora cervicornis TaxID=6130 RepID=A0AAD9QMD7_ACRCE|nr:hypothetical protein P5673_012981 [Acropora cervicornis]
MNAATAESYAFHQSGVYQRFDDQHIAFAAADKNHSFLAPPSFLPLVDVKHDQFSSLSFFNNILTFPVLIFTELDSGIIGCNK